MTKKNLNFNPKISRPKTRGQERKKSRVSTWGRGGWKKGLKKFFNNFFDILEEKNF